MSRVLLDECVPRRLARDFPANTVSHVCDLGWQGLRNGRLLAVMREANIAVLVTVDRNLSFQQNIGASGIAVIVLHAPSNRRTDLLPLIASIMDLLPAVQAGQVYRLGA